VSGLREAVEKLCEAQGEDSYVMVHALRSALASNPPLPAPVRRKALAEEIAQAIEAHRDEPWTLEQALSSSPNGVLSKAASIAREVGGTTNA
jgi:hypothetical protein